MKITFLCPIYFILIFFTGLSAHSQEEFSLPDDFPEINVNVYDDPEPGYIFITPSGLWGYFMDATPYLAIIDNHGTPIYYRELSSPGFDFKLQDNGYLSFHGGSNNTENQIMDSAYNITSTLNVSGFSGTDFHEFLINEDGSSILLGWDDKVVDMSAIVPGGQPNATVRGTLIQEKGPQGNVLWTWSSWGYIDILDCDTSNVDLTEPFIDYIHTNAIDVDDDGNILISSRNLHEISKIDKSTGELIWRMGGTQNEFSYIGDDTLGFSGQHCIRKLDNGNYLLFDNGWFHPDVVSSALELDIDEQNKTATVVKRFRNQPDDITGWIMGSAQRLPGGNTFVGWGSGVPNVSEFKPDGSMALELEFESVSYRAFKHPWKTNIFSASSQSIDFGEIYYPLTVTETIEIYNHHQNNIFITGIHSRTGKYTCATPLPLRVQAGSSVSLDIEFEPVEIGEFNDVLTIYAEWENQTNISAFAIQVDALGSASQEASIQESELKGLRIFPNPAKDHVVITKEPYVGTIEYRLLSIQGDLLRSGMIREGVLQQELKLHDIPAGFYVLRFIEKQSQHAATVKLVVQP